MKLDEAGHAAEIGFARTPNGLESRFRANLHLEPVHCDKHFENLLGFVAGVRLAYRLSWFETSMHRSRAGASAQPGAT
jgi:hypothetical protein